MVEKHIVAWYVAGSFALLAAVVSFAQIRLHLIWNCRPLLRKYVIRILLMVPVYAFESWMGLRYKSAALYFDILRECYEALVIYSFFCFVVEFLGGPARVASTLAEKEQQRHLFPFSCLRAWPMGHDFYWMTRVGTLQYVVIKVILAGITFVLASTGHYEDGSFDMRNGYVYVAFITNASQIWAMYCLILFYLATKKELSPVRPVSKLMCVKAVVFFTFWQSVFLAVLVKIGWIKPTQTYSVDNMVTGLQDFLVCIEMFIAAIAHHWAFHYREFYDPSGGAVTPSMFRSMASVVNVTDVYIRDVRDSLRQNRLRSPQSGSTPYRPLEEAKDDDVGTALRVISRNADNGDEDDEDEDVTAARVHVKRNPYMHVSSG